MGTLINTKQKERRRKEEGSLWCIIQEELKRQ
jgi:hypothetical protein